MANRWLDRLKRENPIDTPVAVDESHKHASLVELGHGLDRQGLFVIGAARSGTTVLQNGLNDSPDIYLLGEPQLHRDPGTADFGARYNAMHRFWGNQENKSSYCPCFFPSDAPWWDYLRELARLHHYAGSKIVINPTDAERECAELFEFHSRYFFRAHYVFTFRDPIDTLMSTRGLAELQGMEVSSWESILHSFVRVMALYIRMLRMLPSVHVIFQEHVTDADFARLRAALNLPLAQLPGYYDATRVRRYTLKQVPDSARALAVAVSEQYALFRGHARKGYERIQLEQNAGHLFNEHYTPLGTLQRRIDQILAGQL